MKRTSVGLAPKSPVKLRPMLLDGLFSHLHLAMASVLNSDVVCEPCEDLYAVLDEESFLEAFAFLGIGIGRYLSHPKLFAEEGESQILIHLAGRLRLADRVPTVSDLLPERADCREHLAHAMRKNGMAYELSADRTAATLTVSLPRFRAQKYVASEFTAEEVCKLFLRVALMLVGAPEPSNDGEEMEARRACAIKKGCRIEPKI